MFLRSDTVVKELLTECVSLKKRKKELVEKKVLKGDKY